MTRKDIYHFIIATLMLMVAMLVIVIDGQTSKATPQRQQTVAYGDYNDFKEPVKMSRVGYTLEDLHVAILEVEGWIGKPGDGGKAIGPYQIWYSYWLDAVRYDKTIGGEYTDCRNPVYARRIVDAYFRRYCRESLASKNWKNIARIHNGGPDGWKYQNATKERRLVIYWNKVQAALLKNK